MNPTIKELLGRGFGGCILVRVVQKTYDRTVLGGDPCRKLLPHQPLQAALFYVIMLCHVMHAQGTRTVHCYLFRGITKAVRPAVASNHKWTILAEMENAKPFISVVTPYSSAPSIHSFTTLQHHTKPIFLEFLSFPSHIRL